jgi:hypothetical protein
MADKGSFEGGQALQGATSKKLAGAVIFQERKGSLLCSERAFISLKSLGEVTFGNDC